MLARSVLTVTRSLVSHSRCASATTFSKFSTPSPRAFPTNRLPARLFSSDVKPEDEEVSAALPDPDTSKGETVVASAEVIEICDRIMQLNVMEVNSLTELFKTRCGITDAELLPSGFGGGGAAAAEAAEPVEEKTIFDVKLTGFTAANKIKVIKEIRTITGLGLKEAKEMVEGAPKVVKKDLKKEEAEALVEKIKAAGGEAELE